MKTKAIVFYQANQPTLQEVEVPPMQPEEVLVRTHYSGLSIGTEQSIFSSQRTHNGTFPVVTGYMTSGVVEAVGSNVKDIAIGDRVVSGGARLEGDVHSVWGAHMGLRVVRPSSVFTVPPSLSMAEAAMWVMPRVGLNALHVAGIAGSETIIIQGQGLIGQFFGQFARARGCRLIVIEPDPHRASLARKYVTPHVLSPYEDDLISKIAELTQGKGADWVVEATGNKKLIHHATALLRPYARMMFLGWYPNEIELDYGHFHNNSVTAYFPMGTGDENMARRTMEALGSGVVTVGDNLTDILPWQQACEGFNRVIAGDRSVMGMVFDWRGV